MSKYKLEKVIENEIRKALSDIGVLVWKNNTDNRNLHSGLGIGCPDLVCVVPPFGRLLLIEVKSQRPGSKVTEEQTRWMNTAALYGAYCGVARSVEEALELVRLAKNLIPYG
jgi:hypothetical protein